LRFELLSAGRREAGDRHAHRRRTDARERSRRSDRPYRGERRR
jgi:hypothetical protein